MIMTISRSIMNLTYSLVVDVVATVTAHAQKEDDCVIAYVFDGKREVERFGFDVFVGDYPEIYYGIKQLPGNRISYLTTAEAKEVNVNDVISYAAAPQNEDPWADYYAMADGMDDANRRATIATIEEMKQSPEYLELVEQETKIQEYWAQMETLSAALVDIPDDEINRNFRLMSSVGMLGKDSYDPNGITGAPTSKVFVIDQYNDENLKRTSWWTYCGPGAVAWAFRGLYDSYPISGPTKRFIPIHPLATRWYVSAEGKSLYYEGYCDSYSVYRCLDQAELLAMYKHDPNNPSRRFDNGFLEAIHSHTTRTGSEYPMYQLGLTNAVKDITKGEYGVQTTTAAHKHIKEKHLPVFICYTLNNGASHYVVAFGTGKIGTKNYVYVMDNNNLISDFGHRAYWRKETTLNYGLRYKIVKK